MFWVTQAEKGLILGYVATVYTLKLNVDVASSSGGTQS